MQDDSLSSFGGSAIVEERAERQCAGRGTISVSGHCPLSCLKLILHYERCVGAPKIRQVIQEPIFRGPNVLFVTMPCIGLEGSVVPED